MYTTTVLSPLVKMSIILDQLEFKNCDTINSPINMSAVTVQRTRVGTLIVATIYLQLIQNRYMFRSFTVLQCSHHHCVQPVASDVEVVGYL